MSDSTMVNNESMLDKYMRLKQDAPRKVIRRGFYTQIKSRYIKICRRMRVAPAKQICYFLDRAALQMPYNMAPKDYKRTFWLAGNNIAATSTRIYDKDVPALCDIILQNPFMSGLDLRYNGVTDEGFDILVDAMSKKNQIEYLNMMFNNLSEVAATKISVYLQSDSTMKKLVWRGNDPGRDGGMYISSVLRNNTTLEELDLSDCFLHLDVVIDLMDQIRNYNRSIKKLNISNFNTLSPTSPAGEAFDHVARAISKNDSLTELYISKNRMYDWGFEQLLNGLVFNNSIKQLDLTANRLTRDTPKMLRDWLSSDPNLEILNLDCNSIMDEGCGYIAEILSKNKQLKTLSIKDNFCTGDGLQNILDVFFEQNKTLQRFYFWQQDNILGRSCQLVEKLLDEVRFLPDNIDCEPYLIDDEVRLAKLQNGLQLHQYWTPTEGPHAHRTK